MWVLFSFSVEFVLLLLALANEKSYFSLPRLFNDKSDLHPFLQLLYIDQHIFNKSKTKLKNIAKACIDNKKAYDVTPLMLDNKVFQNVQDIR